MRRNTPLVVIFRASITTFSALSLSPSFTPVIVIKDNYTFFNKFVTDFNNNGDFQRQLISQVGLVQGLA